MPEPLNNLIIDYYDFYGSIRNKINKFITNNNWKHEQVRTSPKFITHLLKLNVNLVRNINELIKEKQIIKYDIQHTGILTKSNDNKIVLMTNNYQTIDIIKKNLRKKKVEINIPLYKELSINNDYKMINIDGQLRCVKKNYPIIF